MTVSCTTAHMERPVVKKTRRLPPVCRVVCAQDQGARRTLAVVNILALASVGESTLKNYLGKWSA